MKARKSNGTNAVAWFYAQSFNGLSESEARPVKPLAQPDEPVASPGAMVICAQHFGTHAERTTCTNIRRDW